MLRRVGGVFGAIGLLSLAGCAGFPVTGTTPEQFLAQYGYLAQIPPSGLHGLGPIASKRRENINNNTVVLAYICGSSHLVLPESPDSASAATIGFGRSRDFELTALDLPSLGLSASAKYVHDITLSFDNATVEEYSLEDLQTIKDALAPTRKSIVKNRLRKGNAYQVAGVFKADLSYKISYNANISASAKLAVLKELSAAFGLTATGNQSEEGKGLFYGVSLRHVGPTAVANK